MKKHELTATLSKKMLLIRTESRYTQEEMAEVLGLSKKTLVQIEKGRQEASWSTIVALCALFRHSSVLQQTTGGDPLDILQLLAHQKMETRKEKTLGGKIWWKDIHQIEGFKLQQNIISFHFRIIDEYDYRWCSSFDRTEMEKKLSELTDRSIT
ncbi:helix-turn-helix transcriptional regulator [Peribacillus frigoritolerans]|uniref:helix-turn-helix transcriptional regulator n=1 Tax=Peribacillus frigoritolerans TaxID=450367 RepID=UPI001059754E|nr:helix-turn-helix domain-containing protein [Peribacillus frigoritolerans]TDL78641.1 XRE family transcriptional regulator [Peribacillus frigoritolerans]